MSAYDFVAVPDAPGVNTTPLARIVVEDCRVMLEFDDQMERRVRLTFSPYQAIRVTTADCFMSPEGLSMVPNTVVELHDSRWIQELTTRQRVIDNDAQFMKKARHFLVPLQDDFLEVVAWSIKWDLIPPPHTPSGTHATADK